MIAQLSRRAFSSRSAIRAPPAPSSVPPAMAASPARASKVSGGRVAMMPRAASEATSMPGTSSSVSTSATVLRVPQEELIQVGGISSHRDASTVTRIGEDF